MKISLISFILILNIKTAVAITNQQDFDFLKLSHSQLIHNNQCTQLFSSSKKSPYSIKFIRFILSDEAGRLSSTDEKTQAAEDLNWYILNRIQKVPIDLLYFRANEEAQDEISKIARTKAQEEITNQIQGTVLLNTNFHEYIKGLENIDFKDKTKLNTLENLAHSILVHPITEIPDEVLFLMSRLEPRAQDYYLHPNFILSAASHAAQKEIRSRQLQIPSSEYLKKSIFNFFTAPERLSEQELQQLLNLDSQTTFSKYIHEQVMSYLSRLRYAQ